MRYVYGVTAALLLGGAAVSLATGLPAGAQVAQNDSSRMQGIVPRNGAPATFADLAAQLQPAVVNISTRQNVQVQPNPLQQMFGQGPQTRQAQALGTGFIISPDGYLVTNNHVITFEGQGVAESITVKLTDGTEYAARIVGRDAASDVAVLKIESNKPLPFVKFGESGKSRAGDWVMAIGNPFGLGGSVTAGIISAVQRNTGAGAYDHYIQTDASINSGNSGGPMFDMAGNVIGINNWIIAPGGGNIGIGFAIPSDIARPIVDKLMKGQSIERGYLGVQRVPVSDDLADALGIPHDKGEFIQSVVPGGSAANAGMQAGDVVLRIEGSEVTPDNSLSTIVANTAPGTRLRIDLLREGKPRTVTAVVAKRPSDEELAQANFDPTQTPQPGQAQPAAGAAPEGPAEKALGLSVTPLTPQLAGRLGFPADSKGVVILGVDPSSDAAAKQLQRGMVILQANGRTLASKADLEAAIAAAKAANREAVLLRIQPPGREAVYLPIRIR